MKTIFNKADLIEALQSFDDEDQIVIEVHDMIISDDLYQFNVDSISLGEFGNEIRLCVINNENK